MALLFNRFDVDAFLDEISHEQYLKWCWFLAIEPQGWPALQILIQRMSYIMVQAHSAKKVKERDFLITFKANGGVRSAEAQQLADDMAKVRGEVAARIAAKKRAAKEKAKADAKAAAEAMKEKRTRRGAHGRKNDQQS